MEYTFLPDSQVRWCGVKANAAKIRDKFDANHDGKVRLSYPTRCYVLWTWYNHHILFPIRHCPHLGVNGRIQVPCK